MAGSWEKPLTSQEEAVAQAPNLRMHLARPDAQMS